MERNNRPRGDRNKVHLTTDDNSTPHHCFVFKGEIEEIPTPIIVDTGFRISIIGEDFFNNYLRDKKRIGLTNARVLTANGQEMNTCGEINAAIKINNKIYDQDFRIVMELRGDILLRNNFLQKNNAVIRMEDETIMLNGDNTVKGDVMGKTNIRLLKMGEKVVIPS